MGVVLIVSDNGKPERFHIVLQEGADEDFNVTLCGVEVVVEDNDYYLNFDRDYLTAEMLCWECCEEFGRQGRVAARI